LVAPEGVPHGVRNTGRTRLLVLAVLAPAPGPHGADLAPSGGEPRR
jgi:mannose-6-phosphate isomerase-like protein (cupin superfamily)